MPGSTPAENRPCVSVLALLISFPRSLGSSTATIAPASGAPRSSVTTPVTKASAGAASTEIPPASEVLNGPVTIAPSKQPAINTLIAFFISCPPFSNNQRLMKQTGRQAPASFFSRDNIRTSIIAKIVEYRRRRVNHNPYRFCDEERTEEDPRLAPLAVFPAGTRCA